MIEQRNLNQNFLPYKIWKICNLILDLAGQAWFIFFLNLFLSRTCVEIFRQMLHKGNIRMMIRKYSWLLSKQDHSNICACAQYDTSDFNKAIYQLFLLLFYRPDFPISKFTRILPLWLLPLQWTVAASDTVSVASYSDPGSGRRKKQSSFPIIEKNLMFLCDVNVMLCPWVVFPWPEEVHQTTEVSRIITLSTSSLIHGCHIYWSMNSTRMKERKADCWH